MTEKQKMLAGELYLASDPELVTERLAARRLTRAFNATTEDEGEERRQLLNQLLGKVGPQVEIEPPFRCDYGNYTFIGNNFFANFGCIILDCCTVEIGDNVLFGPNVQIYTAYHPVEPAVRLGGRELAAPISLATTCGLAAELLCVRVCASAATRPLARAAL
jgi:maltose O-acetyltransferase